MENEEKLIDFDTLESVFFTCKKCPTALGEINGGLCISQDCPIWQDLEKPMVSMAQARKRLIQEKTK